MYFECEVNERKVVAERAIPNNMTNKILPILYLFLSVDWVAIVHYHAHIRFTQILIIVLFMFYFVNVEHRLIWPQSICGCGQNTEL